MIQAVDPAPKPEPPDPVMAWAKRADGSVVHVSMLSRKETGLACLCTCAGCGARLEAVNAGQPAEHFQKPKAHRMSFRHHAGTQAGDCLRIASRAALLQLLLDEGQVQLPGYQARGGHRGVSGRDYSVLHRGASVADTIKSHCWIDTHNALITLESGRVVRVQLRSEMYVDTTVDAVLTILIDDPEVAAWDRDKILSLARLEVDWVCWDKHWDQVQVQTEADNLAREEAARFLDAPPEAVDPEDAADGSPAAYADSIWLKQDGMTEEQRGETVLHLALKDLMATVPQLQVSAQQFTAFYKPPGGGARSSPVLMPAGTLLLSNARLEQHLGDIVPDVICDAVFEGDVFEEPFELLIEVAVTHRVDELKRLKIQSRGTPCLELDARRLASPGRVYVDRLRALVQKAGVAFDWVYHPRIEAMLAAARERLRREYEQQVLGEEQERRAERARERARLERARQLDTLRSGLARKPAAAALREYFRQLAVRRPSISAPRWSDDFQAVYTGALDRLGQKSWGDAALQELLVLLETIRRSARQKGRGRQQDGARSEAVDAVEYALLPEAQNLRVYVPLLISALKIYGAQASDEAQRDRIVDLARNIHDQVEQGSNVYARQPTYDGALRELFPELKAALAAGAKGTMAYAQRRREEIAEARRQREVEEARADRERREAEAERARQEVDAALEPAKRRNWTRGGGKPFERWSRYEEVAKSRDYRVVQEAYEARERGRTVADFVRSQQLRSKDSVEHLL
ncbi:hypothetical protein WDZ92_27750, partial [Nostoc sp. NIES-2111]